MSKKGKTREELFLLKLYEIVVARGDLRQEIDRYAVGQAIGQNDRSVDNIVLLLVKTHFIKKDEGNAVSLTQNGLRLVESLLEM